jgi:hypothetical protein
VNALVGSSLCSRAWQKFRRLMMTSNNSAYDVAMYIWQMERALLWVEMNASRKSKESVSTVLIVVSCACLKTLKLHCVDWPKAFMSQEGKA